MALSLSESEQRLGQALLSENLLTREKLDYALAEKQKRGFGKSLGGLLLELGYVKQEAVVDVLGRLYNLPVMTAADIAPSLEVLRLIPEEVIRKQRIFPVFLVGSELTVAVTDPSDFHVLDMLREKTRHQIQPVIIGTSDLVKLIDTHFSKEARAKSTPAVDLAKYATREEGEVDARSLEQAGKALPVIEIVDMILTKAVTEGASDIHVEPTENNLRVRFRVDGVLSEELALARHLIAGVTSRFKIVSNLDISERRVPQDGRFRFTVEKRKVDLRVSTLPTYYGEKVVLRILDKTKAIVPLEKLGLAKENLEIFRRLAAEPYGIILVTGPTGSGKTTTLYSALATVDAAKHNVITVEDPVEYQLPRINQVPINTRQGLTFAVALRAILRQDPDVILVGEIRDPETGSIAAEAALTGHLVFATLHTNDAPSSVNRLIEIGVQPYLISPSLLGVIAQRLVRTICPGCRKGYAAKAREIKDLGLEKMNREMVFYRGTGCPACSFRGYRGRTGIHEIMVVDEKIRTMIAERAPVTTLRGYLRGRGFRDMRFDGLRKIAAGITTVEEVLRVTRDVK